MLSLASVVGPSGWWSVFIMCVLGSWHDGALGHWHGNSLAITPTAQRSDWCSYMEHRRPHRSHRYWWKSGFFSSFSSPLFFLSSSLRLMKKGEKGGTARSSAPGQCSPCMRPALSHFPSRAFQFTTPCSLLFLSPLFLIGWQTPFIPICLAPPLFLYFS